jgi:hypothetical protein
VPERCHFGDIEGNQARRTEGRAMFTKITLSVIAVLLTAIGLSWITVSSQTDTNGFIANRAQAILNRLDSRSMPLWCTTRPN